MRKIYNQKEWRQDLDRVSLLELAGITSVDVQREATERNILKRQS